MANKTLVIAKEVTTATEDCETAVPANGKKVVIHKFCAEGPASPNSVVKLIWDWGEAGEFLIWTIKGSGQMPFKHVITDADGVKKLAVCLDNGEVGDVFLSGYIEYFEQD